MQTFSFRINAVETRFETLDGINYLVAPVVAIKEGVLNGELITGEEIGRFVEGWNDILLMIGHPKRGGKHVSAKSSVDVLEENVGMFMNAKFDGNTLRGECWINIDKCKRLGGDALITLERIQNGIPVEVSTAYFSDTVPESGIFDNKEYYGIQSKIVPDHLALLPNDIGACSWEDGCGTPRVNEMEVNKRTSARTPSYSGTEETSWSRPSWSTYKKAWKGDYSGGVDGAPAALKRFAANTSLLGDPSATTFEELVSFPVVNPSNKKLNANALRAAISRAPQASISAEAKASVQRVARRLLQKEFGDSKQNMGTSMKDQIISKLKDLAKAVGLEVKETEPDAPVIVNFYIPDNFEIDNPDSMVVNGRNFSTLLNQIIKDQVTTDTPKRDIIKRLADLAGISKDKVQEVLNGSVSFIPYRWVQGFSTALDIDPWDLMSAASLDGREFIEGNLPAFQTQSEKSEESEESNAEETDDIETNNNEEIVMNTELINKIINNTDFTEEDREWLASLDEEKLAKLTSAEEEETLETNEQEEENNESQEELEANEEEVVAEAEEEATEEGPRKIEDVLAAIPEPYKAQIQQALTVQCQVRDELVTRIVDNSDFTSEDLTDFSIDKLKKLDSSLAKNVSANEDKSINFSGRAIPRKNKTNSNEIPAPPKVVLAKSESK